MATLTTDVSGHVIAMVYQYRDSARRGHGPPDQLFWILLSVYLDHWKAGRLTFACDPECQEADNASSFSLNVDPKAGEGVVYNAYVVDIGTPDAIGWLQRDVPDTVKATLESRGPVQWTKQGEPKELA
jgi:hypothetical protein